MSVFFSSTELSTHLIQGIESSTRAEGVHAPYRGMCKGRGLCGEQEKEGRRVQVERIDGGAYSRLIFLQNIDTYSIR
jgi:hypothetical protein